MIAVHKKEHWDVTFHARIVMHLWIDYSRPLIQRFLYFMMFVFCSLRCFFGAFPISFSFLIKESDIFQHNRFSFASLCAPQQQDTWRNSCRKWTWLFLLSTQHFATHFLSPHPGIIVIQLPSNCSITSWPSLFFQNLKTPKENNN